MNLLIINRYFYPDITSVPQLLTELSEDLVKKGIDVSVICSRNSYNGLKKHKKYEKYRGIKIYRVNNVYAKGKSFFYRLLEIITFFISVFFKGIFIKGIDKIMVFSSPPMIVPVGVLLGKIKKAKVIYVVEDLHPELEIKLEMIRENSLFSRLLRRINRFVFKKSDKVVTLGERMKHTIVSNYKIREYKIHIIPNWADGERLYPLERKDNPFIRKFNLEGMFVVQYSGNMGLAHEFETILKGAEKLKDREDIIFQFIGGGAKREEIESFVKKNNLKNIMLLPYQPYNYLNYSLNMADVSLISVREGIGGLLLPSKFYGILATGKPFILIGDKENEIFDFIKRFKVGQFVKEGDIDKFYDRVLLYYNDRKYLKREAIMLREKFELYYNRKNCTFEYYKIIIEGEGR